MKEGLLHNMRFCPQTLIRRFLLSWLMAATVAYGVLPTELKQLQDLNGMAQMSFVAVIILAVIFFCALTLLSVFRKSDKIERWLMVAVFGILSAMCLVSSFSWAFLIVCELFFFMLIYYAVQGWNGSTAKYNNSSKKSVCLWITAGLAVFFILFVSIWTVCRIYSFCTPTYDFGIFSQMFYNMKQTGLPMTTVERDGMLSHFHVHVSPIYYLFLPIYWLFPFPATLQILQAVVLASAIVPLWLIGQQHGLSAPLRMLLCGVLLFYPAFSGGTSYDLHENAFLAPLVLWLLYAVDRKSIPLSLLFLVLTLAVKEDAAVYTAVIALYLLLRTLLSKSDKKGLPLVIGTLMLLGSVAWFLLVTGYLATVGDGVMTYRYQNFMYDGSGSLMSVIKSVIMHPMKALYECVDSEKLSFIALTMLPLLGLPLFTRRYERLILLIPYVLVNLMSDYRYQHDIFFQYTFGSTALLFYLTAVNLADLKLEWKLIALLSVAGIVTLACFINTVIPKAILYPKYCIENKEYYSQIRETLSLIPDDATVSATTFYTTELSQREILYDVKYASKEHLLSTQYIALAVNSDTNYTKYAVNGENGFENLVTLLESNGYEVFAELQNTLVIYRKAA